MPCLANPLHACICLSATRIAVTSYVTQTNCWQKNYIPLVGFLHHGPSAECDCRRLWRVCANRCIALVIKRQKAHAYLKSGPAQATIDGYFAYWYFDRSRGERVSERRRGPELRNNFCPVKNLSGARLRSRSLSLPLSLFTPERAFLKSIRLWRESEPAWRFFPLLVTPTSHPPFKIREILKKRPGDAESFHDVFVVRVGGAFPLGNC